jgi:hypothetical protein
VPSKKSQEKSKRAIRIDHHDIGTAIVDLRFAAADAAGGARSDTRIVFSFSSDADERSTPDVDDDGDASFAWRSSSVPNMDVGLRALVVAAAAAGGDFTAARPPKAEEMDDTRACEIVGEVVVRGRGGPIEPSEAVRAGLTVVGVGTLFVEVVGLVARSRLSARSCLASSRAPSSSRSHRELRLCYCRRGARRSATCGRVERRLSTRDGRGRPCCLTQEWGPPCP